MNKLNPKDFVTEEVPKPKAPITTEYDSNARFTEEQKNNILQLNVYRHKFIELYDYLLDLDDCLQESDCDECDDSFEITDSEIHEYFERKDIIDYYEQCKTKLCDISFSNQIQPLTFKFNCFLYHDLNNTAIELDKFKQFVLNFMKNMKKEVNGGALSDGIIRDSKGQDFTERALLTMKKALIAATGEINGKTHADIIEEIIEKTNIIIATRSSDYKMKARDDIRRHLKTASILAERALAGTFPYDENGEWELD